MKRLLARKPLGLLLQEMEGENRLRRVLGPVALTSLGIGCIIGTGIFVLTGIAAHEKAGPALTVSYALAGLACVFAALCYSEFASMVPVADIGHVLSSLAGLDDLEHDPGEDPESRPEPESR